MKDTSEYKETTEAIDPVELINYWAKASRPKNPPVPVFFRKNPEVIIENVIYWATRMATCEEIAQSCGVSPAKLKLAILKKLGVTFDHLQQQCQSSAKISLRQSQFEHAKKSASMALWLGKQYLGQKDTDNTPKAPPNDDKLSRLFSIMEKGLGT